MVFIKKVISFLNKKMFELAYPLFCQFLVVRINERIQDLSKSECSGCQNGYRFPSLHPCHKLSLSNIVDMFLSQVVTEVLERMPQLVVQFHKTYAYPTVNYEEWGHHFVRQLNGTQILDRRYINEDTGYMFEYDNSWRESEPFDDLCAELFEACEEVDREEEEAAIPKTKRKAQQNADQPKRKKTKNGQ